MSKSPAFQFYPNDWLSSPKVMLMTPDQEGAYIRLLSIAWMEDDCGLPDDDDELSKLSRLGEGWFNGGSEKIRKCFFEKGGRLFNKRLLKERKKQKEWSKKSSEGGKASAKSRGRKALKAKNGTKGGSRVVKPPYVPNGNTMFSSSSSSSTSLKLNKPLPGDPKPRDTPGPVVKDWKYTESDMALADWFFSEMKGAWPHYKFIQDVQSKGLDLWADEVRKIREIDGKNSDSIHRVLEFAITDKFWKDNLKSLAQIRNKATGSEVTKFEMIQTKMVGSTKKKNSTPQEWLDELED